MAYWYLSVCTYVEHITYNVVCTYHHCNGFECEHGRLVCTYQVPFKIFCASWG